MIIGVALLLVFVLLFFVLNRNQKKGVNKKLNELKALAAKKGYHLSESENIQHVVLGLDRKSNHLLFVNTETHTETVVDLSTIKKCDKQEFSKTVKSGGSSTIIVEKLELICYPLDSKASAISLEIFNVETGSFRLIGEFQFCQKWSKLINQQILDYKKGH